MSQDVGSDPTYGSSQNVDTFPVKDDNAPENERLDGFSLIKRLCDSLAILWKDWPKNMKLNPMPGGGAAFSLEW